MLRVLSAEAHAARYRVASTVIIIIIIIIISGRDGGMLVVVVFMSVTSVSSDLS